MYYITVSTGILKDGHRERMQVNQKTSAIWLYLWILDKITKVDSETGLGWVLGGKPIKLEEIDLGADVKTVRKMFHKLKAEGYIQTRRTPYGQQIFVTKAKKRFGWKIEGFGEGIEVERKEESGSSLSKETSDNENAVGLQSRKREVSSTECGRSNKTIQLDNTVRQVSEQSSPKQKAEVFFQGIERLLNHSPDEFTSGFLKELQEKTQIDKAILWSEIKKFWGYWTEKNSTGKKERWQMERTFEVERRLLTWLSKNKQFKQQQGKSKYQAKRITIPKKQ